MSIPTLTPFPGGLLLPAHKENATQSPIINAAMPQRLIFPLQYPAQQHHTVPAVPQVSVGDTVLKGQCIAQGDTPNTSCIPVHASTSGTVMAIEDHPVPHPDDTHTRCIIVEPDGQDKWITRKKADVTTLDNDVIFDRIAQAGIIGQGGAGFPCIDKLHSQDKAIHTLIINGAECEPYICCDDSLMRERADTIIEGTRILQQLLKPEHCYLAIEDNKPDAIAAVQKAAKDTAIDIIVVPTRYPIGGELQLIQTLTGQEVPSGNNPTDIGILCHNVGTVAAVYHAVALDEPSLSRIITLTGDSLDKQGNLEVLIGTPIDSLLDEMGVNRDTLSQVIMGGPLMGFAVHDLNSPVLKTTNCLIAATREALPPPKAEMPCIRCGRCEPVCPASLLPQQLYWYARDNDAKALTEYNLFDCIECGACAYVCPSHIPLVDYYRKSKHHLRQAADEKARADKAKQRFDAREKRLVEQAAARDARKQGGDKQSAIAAAIARAKAKDAK